MGEYEYAQQLKMALKKQTRYILLGMLAIVIVAGIYAYTEYVRKPADLAGAKVDIVVSATQLFNEYSKDEKAANAKYFNKVINVRGVLKSIDKDHSGGVSLSLDSGDPISGVSCELDARHVSDGEHVPPGDSLTVTGTCAGLLTDVILNRCSVERK